MTAPDLLALDAAALAAIERRVGIFANMDDGNETTVVSAPLVLGDFRALLAHIRALEQALATERHNAAEWVKESAALLYERGNLKDVLGELPSPDRLRLLADWFDKYDADQRRNKRVTDEYPDEVQRDLRRWANGIEAARALASGAAAGGEERG